MKTIAHTSKSVIFNFVCTKLQKHNKYLALKKKKNNKIESLN